MTALVEIGNLRYVRSIDLAQAYFTMTFMPYQVGFYFHPSPQKMEPAETSEVHSHQQFITVGVVPRMAPTR
jgi:hypothetical protein